MASSISFWLEERNAIKRVQRALERRPTASDLEVLPVPERELVTNYLDHAVIVPELEGAFSNLACAAEENLLRAACARLIHEGCASDVAWRRSLLRFKQEQLSLSMKTLDFWWMTLADQHGVPKESRAQVIDNVVDLSTGPAPGQLARRSDKADSYRSSPAGVVQRVFLVSPFGASQDRENGQLEQFAESVAGEDTRLDGVIALAGVRGSGKSTALNYVEQACRAGKDKSPLVVRIDLSASFDPVQFARDFVDLVARDARLHIENNTRHAWIRRLNLLLGHCASWCQTNLGWAMLAAVLLASVIGISHCYVGHAQKKAIADEIARLDTAALAASERMVAALERARLLESAGPGSEGAKQAQDVVNKAKSALDRTSNEADEARKRLDASYADEYSTPPPINLVLVGERTARDVHAVFLTLVLVLVLGSAHALRALRDRRPSAISTRAGTLSVLLVLCVALLAMGSALDWLNQTTMMRALWTSPFAVSTPKTMTRWSTSLLVPYSASLVLLTLAILFLPRWWSYYLRFQHVRKSVRIAGLPQIPQVGSLLGPLGQLLPQRDDPDQVDEQSLPFVQRQAREVLQHAVDAFGSVVLLVDDVDMLPADDFPELLRALRPVIKVPRACCLLAVPLFFYDAMKSTSSSDLHSTLRQCLVLGNPDMFGGEDQDFAVRADARRSHVWDNLLMLLRARLVVTLRLPPPTSVGSHQASGLRQCTFFGQLLEDWGFDTTSADNELRDRERVFLETFGQSRREILRMLAQRAPGNIALGVPVDVRQQQARWRDSLRRRRRQYAEAESLISNRA